GHELLPLSTKEVIPVRDPTFILSTPHYFSHVLLAGENPKFGLVIPLARDVPLNPEFSLHRDTSSVTAPQQKPATAGGGAGTTDVPAQPAKKHKINRFIWLARVECARWGTEWFIEAEGTKEGREFIEHALQDSRNGIERTWEVLLLSGGLFFYGLNHASSFLHCIIHKSSMLDSSIRIALLSDGYPIPPRTQLAYRVVNLRPSIHSTFLDPSGLTLLVYPFKKILVKIMDPLQAALSSSFTAQNVPKASPSTTSPTSGSQANPVKDGGAAATSRGHTSARSIEGVVLFFSVVPCHSVLEEERRAAMDDSWKHAYDERLKEWKADNAARREQSEKTRGEWEKRRSQDLEASYSMPPSAAHSSMASSFVDARDLVAGEGEGGHGTRALD
ncbi:14290_t:CDS:2, partial [Acaulospora colombiana]